MSTYKRGIDVSEHQGTIDWEKVKASGVEFAIIRAGYGRNNPDKQFVRNITACNRLGIPCGVYWFSYAYTPKMAAQEALYCLEAVKPYRVEYPVAFDFEYDSVRYAEEKGITVQKALSTAMADAFCNAIQNDGYYTALYTNLDYLQRYFAEELLDKYDLWLAQWPKTVDLENPPAGAGIWQYTSSGTVPGISGRVDCNAAYVDYPEVIRGAGLNRLEAVGGHWWDEDVDWAKGKGIMDGTRLEEPATRAEVVAMLRRALR